jgi:cytochrome c
MSVLYFVSCSLNKVLRGFIFLGGFIFLFSCNENGPDRMLVLVDPTSPSQEVLSNIMDAASEAELRVDTTTDPGKIVEDSLANYSSLLLLAMPADTLEFPARIDVQRFAEAGGGILFLNNLPDTVINWPWLQKINVERLKAGGGETVFQVPGQKVYFANHTGKAELDKNLRDVIDDINEGKPDMSKATTLRVPESNRFVVEVLDTYMYEPMEMVVFDDGRVLYVERRGDIKIYDPKIKKTKVVANFDVSITGNYEDGILGVTLDPDFKQNHWIYINYSPAGSVAKQNVSRFEMRGDSIIRSTEKIVLEIPTQRETCCHSGGHLTFGPGRNLYISTGDNTSSKESDGFTPIDERPGRGPFDAQKSSGNTHDLRGKILRIHPEPDGTYTIPDGNLFPKDGSQGKPEIFVMGTRNAFRFSVDPKTGYVYWGDVGPDGGITNERGPESYDEFNQAKAPGNYGWPYFVADNKAYADFDFATNKIGPRFNPEKPENTSPNNTGSRFLPPARKPMIWYPYGDSKEFPMLGKGSRSAMAGPVYYYEDFKNARTRFPEYYNRKLFIYEWARSWVKVVSFDEDWNISTIEPFLPEQEWYKPIDMKFGPDGSMYVLQYGANYFEHNPDSRLVKITYIAGNREPIAKLSADKTVGAVPLTIRLDAAGSFDADKGDELKYTWEFPGSDKNEINGATAVVTYIKPGVYRPRLKVTDKEGKTASADVLVRAGNDMPQVKIETTNSNRTFYFDGRPLTYEVSVTDKEDGNISNGVNPSDVFVSFDYLKEGKDLALLQSNSQMAGSIRYVRGKNLLETSDCKSCHNIKETSIGPSYVAVAERYKGKNVSSQLAEKIIKGGSGNWGKNIMAAHPQHTTEEAVEMAKYILAVNEEVKGLPVKGTVAFTEHQKNGAAGFYVMRASYTDKGAASSSSLTNSGMLILRHPRVQAEDMTFDKRLSTRHIDGTDVTFVGDITNGSEIVIGDVDMSGISSVRLNAASLTSAATVELRSGSSTGDLLAQASLTVTDPNNPRFQAVTVPVKKQTGTHRLVLVFRNNSDSGEAFAGIDWIQFINQ